MKQKIFMYYSGFATFALLAVIFIASTQSEARFTSTENNTTRELPQIIRSVDINRPFVFAEEPLPTQNRDVRERLDRELTVNAYWHSSTVLNIKNAAKYFPVIEPILRTEKVPEDFKYVAIAESGLRNVTSPAGAKGIWQFMPATASAYGLEINEEVDERYNLEKSTRAACQLIKDYYEQFGSWTMAAAAYNAGNTNISKYSELQRADTYFDLNLSQENARYIFRVVAIKEIIERPADFGFYLSEGDKYEPFTDFRQITIDQPIENLGDFAVEHGISYRMLKVYNPWLLTHTLSNPKRKEYKVKLPNNSLR